LSIVPLYLKSDPVSIIGSKKKDGLPKIADPKLTDVVPPIIVGIKDLKDGF